MKRNIKTKYFGPHLRIDAYEVNRERLEDLNILYRLLDELPDLIGVHKSGLPQIGGWKEPSKMGVTGIIVIEESHISFHSFSKKGFIAIDIFSCKEFDKEKALKYIRNLFCIKKKNMDIKFDWRGKRFPAEDIYD